MLWKHILLAAGAIGVANAQSSDSANRMNGQMPTASGAMNPQESGAKKGPKGPQVPADLSAGFKKDQITLKIKFGGHGKGKGKGKKDKGNKSSATGSATESAKMPKSTDGKGKGKGKGKGHGLTLKETTKAPKFYLGKAEGANDQSKWVIVAIDTTSEQNRILHYVRSDYKMEPPKAGKDMNKDAGKDQGNMSAMGDMGMKGKGMGMKMKLNSTIEPQMPWKAPGSLGDQGGKRQYTFLMYSQPASFPAQGMPQPGQSIDMKQFVQMNGLQPAVAGKTVEVDTSMNGTKPATGGSSGAAVDKAASGSASSLQGSAYAAGVVSTIFAFTMALL